MSFLSTAFLCAHSLFLSCAFVCICSFVFSLTWAQSKRHEAKCVASLIHNMQIIFFHKPKHTKPFPLHWKCFRLSPFALEYRLILASFSRNIFFFALYFGARAKCAGTVYFVAKHFFYCRSLSLSFSFFCLLLHFFTCTFSMQFKIVLCIFMTLFNRNLLNSVQNLVERTLSVMVLKECVLSTHSQIECIRPHFRIISHFCYFHSSFRFSTSIHIVSAWSLLLNA